MSRYDPLYKFIQKLESNHQIPIMIPSTFEFPFPTMYQSQHDLIASIPPESSFSLVSHTGWGKSPVFLSLIRGSPSIVIEPRKFLQEQIAKYYSDYILYGRSGYPCKYAYSAASAPCLLKEECSDTSYHAFCPNSSNTCLNKPCKIFPVKDTYVQYPCQGCVYNEAVREAQGVLNSGGVVICNFGNFWNLLKSAKNVVVDEADLFFKEISSSQKMAFSNPRDNSKDSIETLLKREVRGLRDAAKNPDAGARYSAQNKLYNMQFLLTHHDLCFTYQRKDWFYIEIDPRNVNILSKKLFQDKRLIIVSATPGSFDIPSYSASIHQRCGVFFAPVGNMTSRSLKQNPYLMNSAAKAIEEISNHMLMCNDAEKILIFCGNLGTHAASLYKILGENDCIIHQSGKLLESLEKFKNSNKRYFLVAGAEWGLDASWCKLQFLLKHPYPNLDERARTLQRVMGPEFNSYYESEARNRVIQTFGRNVRGFDDFGITICLDSKTHDDYVKHKMKYPEWVQSRVDERVY